MSVVDFDQHVYSWPTCLFMTPHWCLYGGAFVSESQFFYALYILWKVLRCCKLFLQCKYYVHFFHIILNIHSFFCTFCDNQTSNNSPIIIKTVKQKMLLFILFSSFIFIFLNDMVGWGAEEGGVLLRHILHTMDLYNLFKTTAAICTYE